MARIRTIKPEFFDDIKLSEVSAFARLTFIGLWTQADREGRLEYEPKRLKVRILPFDVVDFHALIEELITAGVVSLYDAGHCKVLQVKGFAKHQRPHPKEPVSELPAFAVAEHVQAVEKNGEPLKGHDEPVRKGREGKGREGKGREQEGNGVAGESDAPFTSPAEPPSHPFPRWLTEWHAAYPKSRRVSVRHVEQAFVSAFFRHADEPPALFARMMAALDNHKVSAEWGRGVIPSMAKWLNEDWWLRTLPPPQALTAEPRRGAVREPQWAIDARAAQAKGGAA